ncbi:hypothetical protein GCM10010156_02470 [Planobispora rosea]|uniref:Response regulatory domain-containing protein n=1 Tax=Planobispora rosea TaxID=35762 RepID=A0A8J3RX16_PLARO|nr:response regulator [Planobispora rosea]GGS47238.1 hypothetical protein GCM10010156_02470 [Planobispora rosea]GIH82240.1 hypothetical protein Pro02_06480 [Planobispora rosea]
MARLLVVEDEPDVRELIVCRVRDDGHRVLAVDTAAAALEAVGRHGSPDAAVLDVDLPGMDGIELLERLRQTSPDLPVLFVTVWWSAGVIGRIQATGCPYLAKPFSHADLRAALQRALSPADGADGAGKEDRR